MTTVDALRSTRPGGRERRGAPATGPDRRLVGPWPLANLVSLLLALAAVWLVWSQVPGGYRVDLDVYRAGGRAVLDGVALSDVDVLGLPFTYPPFAAVVFVPLALLGTEAARIVFTLVSLAAFVVSGGLVARRLGLTLPQAAPLLLVGLALEPLRWTASLGQVNTLLLLAVVLDALVVTRGRGWLVGIAAGIKLTPAVFVVYFALRRDWAAVRRSALAFGVTVLVAMAVAPASSVAFWTGGFAALGKWGVDTLASVNQSLYGAVLALAGTGVDRPWLSPAILLLGVGLGALVARRLLAEGDEVGALVSVAVGGLLGSPVSWSHHWVWALPALLVLLRRGRRVAVVVLTVVFLRGPIQNDPASGDGLRVALWWLVDVGYVVAGLAILLLLALPARRARPAPDGPPSPERGSDPSCLQAPVTTIPHRPRRSVVSLPKERGGSDMPGWLSRRLHRRERGAVAVETALMSMVLVTILGGMIDTSMLLRDSLSVSSATRAAARTGAVGAAGGHLRLRRGWQAVNAMSEVSLQPHRRSCGSTRQTSPVAPRPRDGHAPSNCFKFTVSSSGTLSSPTGLVESRRSLRRNSMEAMGVYVEYRHPSTVGMFFDDQLIRDNAIMQFEPVPSARPACRHERILPSASAERLPWRRPSSRPSSCS